MKKTLSFFLAFGLIFGSIFAMDFSPFSDFGASHWSYKDVDFLRSRSIIGGYPDNTFRPDSEVTWAEFCKMLFSSVYGHPREKNPGEKWYVPYIELGTENGIDLSVNDFNAPILRIEAARLILKIGILGPFPPEILRLQEYVSDYDTIPAGDRQTVLKMLYCGIMVGDTGGRFNANDRIKRSEAAAVIARVIDAQRRKPTAIPTLAIDGLNALTDRSMIITVTSDSLSSVDSLVNGYELIDGVWVRKFKDLKAQVGSKGMMYQRKQSTLKTPAGLFGFVFAFGNQINPGVNPLWNYRPITDKSYWVLDSSHPLYNRWTEGKGTFKDYEKLTSFGHQYNYAMVIDFNYDNPVKGDGGAIFMHVEKGDGRGTAGCVALKESDLLKLMLWLDPTVNPCIIICPSADLKLF